MESDLTRSAEGSNALKIAPGDDLVKCVGRGTPDGPRGRGHWRAPKGRGRGGQPVFTSGVVEEESAMKTVRTRPSHCTLLLVLRCIFNDTPKFWHCRSYAAFVIPYLPPFDKARLHSIIMPLSESESWPSKQLYSTMNPRLSRTKVRGSSRRKLFDTRPSSRGSTVLLSSTQ